MSQRVIAIGDIHGCAAALRRLIEIIAPDPDDTLIIWAIASIADPDSRGVIDQLLDAPRAVPADSRSWAITKR